MKNRMLDYLVASQEGAQGAATSIQDFSEKAQDEITQRLKQFESYIKENPAVGLGIAVGFGLMLGWVIKRR